jgi:hypothetical protein
MLAYNPVGGSDAIHNQGNRAHPRYDIRQQWLDGESTCDLGEPRPEFTSSSGNDATPQTHVSPAASLLDARILRSSGLERAIVDLLST